MIAKKEHMFYNGFKENIHMSEMKEVEYDVNIQLAENENVDTEKIWRPTNMKRKESCWQQLKL